MNANVEARPERGRLTAGETIADSRAMTARQLRKILRRPTYIVYLFVQPVILVLLLRYVFGGAINTGRIGYVDFLMPGIIVMTAVFGALTTGLGLTEDLKAGVVDRFRSLPIARSAVLLGRTAADLVMNTLALILMLLIGVAVGFRPDQPFYEVALAFALVLAFAYVFSWISAYVGLSVGDPETAQSAGFIWVFPLVSASSAFVPTASMPGVVHTFADPNPVTQTANAARALTIGHQSALGPTLATLAWLAGLLLVFVPLAVRALRRARPARRQRPPPGPMLGRRGARATRKRCPPQTTNRLPPEPPGLTAQRLTIAERVQRRRRGSARQNPRRRPLQGTVRVIS
jgi:ABC-type polysaccharide/polyol phosphate export permease